MDNKKSGKKGVGNFAKFIKKDTKKSRFEEEESSRDSGRGKKKFEPRDESSKFKHTPKSFVPKNSTTKPDAASSKPMRLNKYIANSGQCSRRDADELIKAGEVTVNGKVVTEMGLQVSLKDKVIIKGKRLSPESKVYVLLNKPRGFVTTADDPQNRKTVLDLVNTACDERIYPVGRLDKETTGVLLITNDGEMTKRLTHPKYNRKKIYHVFLDKPFASKDFEKVLSGVELEDGEMHADALNYASDDKTEVGIEIHSGKKRIVRRLFAEVGYTVVKLDRVYFCGLTKKNVPRGKWRHLSDKEVNVLKMM